MRWTLDTAGLTITHPFHHLLFSYVEEKAEVKGLSFVDDVAWLAEGKPEEEICDKLETAALFAQENVVTFDTEKRKRYLSPGAKSATTGQYEQEKRPSISTNTPLGV